MNNTGIFQTMSGGVDKFANPGFGESLVSGWQYLHHGLIAHVVINTHRPVTLTDGLLFVADDRVDHSVTLVVSSKNTTRHPLIWSVFRLPIREWKGQSMVLTGKENRSGLVGAVMTFQQVDGNGVTYYCQQYTENVNKTALVIMNLRTYARSTAVNVSQLVSSLYIDGAIVNQNYNIAQSSSGGFYVSATGAETISPGAHQIRLCSAARSVTDWTATYSVSILQ